MPRDPKWLAAARADGRLRETRVNPAALTPADTADRPAWSFTAEIDTRVLSEANRRDHWAARNRRFRDQAEALRAALMSSPFSAAKWPTVLPVEITWTHVGRTMDSDNLAGAFKGLRDALAQWFGIDDGDPRLTWLYAQRPGPAGVELTVRSRPR